MSINYLDEFIRKRRVCTPSSTTIYLKVDEFVEKLAKYTYLLVVPISCTFGFIGPVILLSIYKHMNNESFQQLYPGTFPFDWKTPAGYFWCMMVQSLATYFSGFIFVSTFTMVFGFCIFLTSIITDLENDLLSLNEDISALENSEWDDINHIELKRKLFEMIAFYFEAKLIAIRFSDLFKPVIFPYIIYAITSFCCLFFQISLSLENASIIDILHFVIPTSVGIFWLFVFCFFGDYLTQRYEDLSDAMFQISWLLLPLRMQNNFPIFLALAQNNIYLEGYGGIQVLFKKIMNTTFSYFLVLQQLSR